MISSAAVESSLSKGVTAVSVPPRDFTSDRLDRVFPKSYVCVASARTGVPSAIKEIEPCFSSPAG